MISKISMRNCATYDENGIELVDCSKVNFIYGSNGSGKSTISNYFQDTINPKYHDCSVVWDYGQQLEVLVYNKRFKDSNFSGDIDGIFTLGKDVIEDVRTIEEHKKRRELLSEKIKQNQTQLNQKNKELNKRIQDFQDTIDLLRK